MHLYLTRLKAIQTCGFISQMVFRKLHCIFIEIELFKELEFNFCSGGALLSRGSETDKSDAEHLHNNNICSQTRSVLCMHHGGLAQAPLHLWLREPPAVRDLCANHRSFLECKILF